MNKSVVLALDIGGTNIRLALIAKDGTVMDRYQSSCQINEGLSAFLTAIGTSLDEIIRSAALSGHEIVALGAGVPGLIDLSGAIISPSI